MNIFPCSEIYYDGEEKMINATLIYPCVGSYVAALIFAIQYLIAR